MPEQEPSQSMHISGGQFSGVQIGQAGRDLQQTLKTGGEAEASLTAQEVTATLQQIEQLLHVSQLEAGQKRKATRYVEAAKEAVLEDTPDKQYVAVSLEQATKVFKEASATVEAGQGLWEKVKPLITKILPWLGVAASFFA